jgi:hypothetical protein
VVCYWTSQSRTLLCCTLVSVMEQQDVGPSFLLVKHAKTVEDSCSVWHLLCQDMRLQTIPTDVIPTRNH